MIEIAIDGNEANIINRVGVNVYAYQILHALHKLEDKQKSEIIFTIYLKENPLPDLPKKCKYWHYVVIPSNKPFWIITKLSLFMWGLKKKPNVFFSPSHYTMPLATFPRVIAIMDLGYLKNSPQFEKKVFWQLKYWTAISILASKKILAISQATKEDIVRHYKFASDKIHITHLGYDKSTFTTSINKSDVRRVMDKYSIGDNYILYIGTLKPSKNVEGLIKSFAILRDNNRINSDYQLVIAGKKGWLYENIFEMVKKLHLEDHVVFTDFFPDNEKPMLIKGAKLLVAPSYWEGFGLHALEAMACGVPVVVSGVGSFPEVVGKAGILIDPYDIESIASGIEKVINLPEVQYNKLVSKGLEKASQFSWERTARETLEVLVSVANQK